MRNGTLAAMTAAFAITLASPVVADASIIVIEPDDFAAGTDLGTVVPGITLSVDGSGGPVRAINDGAASTGNLTFGNDAANGIIANRVWFEGNGFSPRTPGPVLRIEIAALADSISIDIINQDTFDGGILRVFDSAGTELESVSGLVTSAFGPAPGPQTLSITRATHDIAFATVAGVSAQDSVHLDHLRIGVRATEPAAVALLAMGLALVALTAGRRG